MLVATLVFVVGGLWWALAPSMVIRLYSALGASYIGRIGPQGVRGIGYVLMIIGMFSAVALALT